MRTNIKEILNETFPLSLKEKTELIVWIAKSIEKDSLKFHEKEIRRYSGVLKSKRDALISATSIIHDTVLFSENEKDFGKVEGLKFLNP